jgi:hypothetical protein
VVYGVAAATANAYHLDDRRLVFWQIELHNIGFLDFGDNGFW